MLVVRAGVSGALVGVSTGVCFCGTVFACFVAEKDFFCLMRFSNVFCTRACVLRNAAFIVMGCVLLFTIFSSSSFCAIFCTPCNALFINACCMLFFSIWSASITMLWYAWEEALCIEACGACCVSIMCVSCVSMCVCSAFFKAFSRCVCTVVSCFSTSDPNARILCVLAVCMLACFFASCNNVCLVVKNASSSCWISMRRVWKVSATASPIECALVATKTTKLRRISNSSL